MPRISFAQLVRLYQVTNFQPADQDEAIIQVAAQDVLDCVQMLDRDEAAAQDADITILDDVSTVKIGATVRVRIGKPRLALGRLARDLDELLDGPEARIAEPASYFVIDGQLTQDAPSAGRIGLYRKLLRVITILAEAASYLDRMHQELLFFRDAKLVLPIVYDAAAIDQLAEEEADKFIRTFAEEINRDQKLEILADSVDDICRAQAGSTRFAYLIRNLDELNRMVADGYKIFVSSFSYSKIRSELETTRLEYIAKINKTFVDIQGQLLGIPVATVIVGSQLKLASTCGVDLWTDVAVMAGAWIFLILFAFAAANQWITLSAVRVEIERQQKKLQDEYAAISGRFVDVFKGLLARICWQRFVLVVIFALAVGGAVFATYAFGQLVRVDVWACLRGQIPFVVPKAP